MSLTSRATSLQAYNMLVFRNALHPEFFGIEGRARIEHNGYDCEAWIFKGGHAIRFEFANTCVQEIVTDQIERLPSRGLVVSLQCMGERDHDADIGDALLMTSMQTETLSDHLYLSTYAELQEHAQEADALLTSWTDDLGRLNMSMLEMQRYSKEVHLQAYHLRSDCSLVLRTQSIYQVKK